MSNFRIFLKANERIFINGAVFKVDRKVSLELLNNATFLLENHIMQNEDATTPFKQLYFVVQLLLIDPNNTQETRKMFREMVQSMLETLKNEQLRNLVKMADLEVSSGKEFAALKTIRSAFPIEEVVLGSSEKGMLEATSLKSAPPASNSKDTAEAVA